MNTSVSATRSRWLDWQPKPQNFTESPKDEPTKPSKPGFVGFEGSPSVNSQKIEAGFVGFEGALHAVSTRIETGPEPAGVQWAEWHAAALNRLFDELGTPGPGRTPAKIKPETIEDGLRKTARRCEKQWPAPGIECG